MKQKLKNLWNYFTTYEKIWFISITVLAFVFGTCDPSEMIFFLGMPLWWTGGVIVYLAMFIIGMVHLKKSKTYSMLPREPKEEVTEK